MGPLLILDGNPLERRFIAALANGRYRPVLQAGDAEAAGNALLSLEQRLALIVAALDPVERDAVTLLRWMHNARSTIPVVVIAEGSARGLESKARSLGARVFVYDPADFREMRVAMEEAVRELSQQEGRARRADLPTDEDRATADGPDISGREAFFGHQ